MYNINLASLGVPLPAAAAAAAAAAAGADADAGEPGRLLTGSRAQGQWARHGTARTARRRALATTLAASPARRRSGGVGTGAAA
jgi:hypothetical protein